MPIEVLENPKTSETTTGPIATHSIHPANRRTFREMADSTKDIKERRGALVSTCSYCGKLGTAKDLMLCAKCKIAGYCSKQCQKNQWPLHKLVCKEPSAAANIKLVHSFAANTHMQLYLQLAFILTFDLHKKMIVDRPLIVRCDLAVDPAQIITVARLVTGEQTPADFPDGVEGMLQIKSCIPLDSSKDVDADRMRLWRDTKARLSLDGTVKNAIGLVDFCMEGTEQSITMTLPIYDLAIEEAKAGGFFTIESTVTRNQKHEPLTPKSCLSAINFHIRDDKKNQLKLRTHMPQESLKKYAGVENVAQLEMLPANISVTLS